jgi:hypothetical protein
MIRLLFFCLILGVLGGCSVMNDLRKDYIYETKKEKEEARILRFAEYRVQCTKLGFNPQNVEHTNCVLSLEQSWVQAEAVKKAASSINTARAAQLKSSPITPAPVIIFAD